MIPTFTLVTTLITVTVTVILILILYRINAPMLTEHKNKQAVNGGHGGAGEAAAPVRTDETASDGGRD